MTLHLCICACVYLCTVMPMYTSLFILSIVFNSSFFFYLCLDNQPEERPQIDESLIADSVNPHINVSWNPLLVCEGGEYLKTYVVEIRITNQGKRVDEVIRFDVNKDTTSFQYDGVQPFTTYDIQMFGNLTIDDRNLLVALTSTQSVDSPESGMYVRMYVCMYACMYICMYVCMYVCVYILYIYYIYIYTFIYIYIYIYIFIYICVSIYVCICTQSLCMQCTYK